MRPDLSGVIGAVATGSRIPSMTFHWLCSLAQLTSRQLVAIEHKQDANGFNGELNLRMVGPAAFQNAMVMYFAKQGLSSTVMCAKSRALEQMAV